MKKVIYSLLLAVMFIIGSCKKNDTDLPIKTINISTENSNVKTYQVIKISVTGKILDQEMYTATLGDTGITLGKVNDSTLAFMIPANSVGTKELKTDIASNKLIFTIAALPAIPNPDVIIGQYMSTIPVSLDKIVAYLDTTAVMQGIDKATLKKDIAKTKQRYQDQLAAYAGLTSEDKMACASFLLGNKETLDRIQVGTEELMVSMGMKKKSDCLSEIYRLEGVNCKTEKLMEEILWLGTGSTIGIASGAIIGGPLGIAVAGLIVGLVVDKQYYAIISAWEDLANETWSLETVTNWIIRKNEEKFLNNEESKLSFQIEVRNIKASDAGKGALASKIVKLYNKLLTGAKKIGFEFLPKYANETYSVVNPEKFEFITLSINNSNITGKLTGTPGDLKVTFSTKEQTEQRFAFEIIYNDGENIVKSASINAIINMAPLEVRIGSQIWMKTNLNISTYRNGDTIPQVQDPTEWANLTTGAWCYYANNSGYGKVYGKLYNWYAVQDPRGLAPAGWHVPNDNDWTALNTYLGGDEAWPGDKMKEKGFIHWEYDNLSSANNSSGFTALPAGTRSPTSGKFDFLFTSCGFWSEEASVIVLNNVMGIANKFPDSDKKGGFSVRCIKD